MHKQHLVFAPWSYSLLRSDGGYRILESQNPAMVWVGRDLKAHLVPALPLSQCAPSPVQPGLAGIHGQPQLLWTTCARASPL